MNRHGLAAIALVLLAGSGILWNATDGFQTLTSEQARRLSIAARPRAVPDVALQDQDGRVFRLSDYDDQTVVVDFIYTHCATLCQAMGATFRQLAERLASAEVMFLSISFDTARDSPAALGEYARWHHADGTRWRIARLADPADLPALLETFAVVVIPDEYGGYQHNAAVHVITEGRLIRVLDYDEPVEILADDIRHSS
jgi:protein SCO1/2